MSLLEVKDLHASAAGHGILRGLSLSVGEGEVHAIMGPNGSGKSTLAHVVAGREGYEISQGTVLFQGEDLLGKSPEDRARQGVFLAFQYPVEIPGVNNAYFLRSALNAQRKHRGQEELDAVDFLELIKAEMAELGMDSRYSERSVNHGFSGGEKKKNEILQLNLLKPTLAFLDETDSGLDIDALKVVAQGVNRFRGKGRAVVLVTHYQRLLEHVVPDYVHVLAEGRLVKSGGKELALELEEKGYEWLAPGGKS